jgi:hypothetical protein
MLLATASAGLVATWDSRGRTAVDYAQEWPRLQPLLSSALSQHSLLWNVRQGQMGPLQELLARPDREVRISSLQRLTPHHHRPLPPFLQ